MTHTTAWGWWARRGACTLLGHACQWYAAARVTRAAALHLTTALQHELIGPGDLSEHPIAEGWGELRTLELALGWLSVEVVSFTLPETR
jgi:hypothetical protein